jgi:hypothetical protein
MPISSEEPDGSSLRGQARCGRAGARLGPADRRDRPRAGHRGLDPWYWVRQERTDGGEQDGLTRDERARLGQLEADNARLRMERDLLKRTVEKTEHQRVDVKLCKPR